MNDYDKDCNVSKKEGAGACFPRRSMPPFGYFPPGGIDAPDLGDDEGVSKAPSNYYSQKSELSQAQTLLLTRESVSLGIKNIIMSKVRFKP
ncbi:MAG: hypothetical protein LBD28_05015, partial [Tannerellaceae bacterium]|nr:hypothetical protein [Tannerellaceae bacterium]